MTPNTLHTRTAIVTKILGPELYELFLCFLRSLPQSKLQAPPSAPPPHREHATFEHTVQESLRVRLHCRPSTRADLRSYANRILTLSNWRYLNLRNLSSHSATVFFNMQ